MKSSPLALVLLLHSLFFLYTMSSFILPASYFQLIPPKLIGYRPMYALRSTMWRQIGHTIRNSTTSTAGSWAAPFATGLVWSVNALSRLLYRPCPSNSRSTRGRKGDEVLAVSFSEPEYEWRQHSLIYCLLGIPNQAAGLNTSISTWNGILQMVLSRPSTLLNTSILPSSKPHEKVVWSPVLDLSSKAG